MTKQKHITYKVWLEIEEYDENTEHGKNMDAPGSSLAAFDSYEEAWDYAERVTNLTISVCAQAIVLDLVQLGLMTLDEGEAEFDGAMYWFDHQQADWCVGVIAAIGWEAARAAIANAATA